jgi:hypothetical protein
MVSEILRVVYVRQRETLGRPYHVVLGIGLVLEIIARVRELHERRGRLPASCGWRW